MIITKTYLTYWRMGTRGTTKTLSPTLQRKSRKSIVSMFSIAKGHSSKLLTSTNGFRSILRSQYLNCVVPIQSLLQQKGLKWRISKYIKRSAIPAESLLERSESYSSATSVRALGAVIVSTSSSHFLELSRAKTMQKSRNLALSAMSVRPNCTST